MNKIKYCLLCILLWGIGGGYTVFGFGRVEESSFNYPVKEQYLSPVNQDGVNDVIDLTLAGNIEAAARARLQTVFFNVYDGQGNNVLSRTDDFTSIEKYTFDGKNAIGDYLPDGYYVYTIGVQDNKGNVSTSQPYPVVIDNIPPEIRHTRVEGGSVVSFNSNVIIDIQSQTSKEIEWNYIVVGEDSTRRVIFSQVQDTPAIAPISLMWNGTDEFNNLIPDGTYTLHIEGKDRAGNVNIIEVFPQIIVSHEGVVSIFLKNEGAFSPNGDGVKDNISIGIAMPLSSSIGGGLSLYNWNFLLYSGKEEVYRESFEHDDSVIFSGFDSNGNVIRDGVYTLFVEYTTSSNTLKTNGVDIVIDTSPPQASISIQTAPTPIADGESLYFGSDSKQSIRGSLRVLEDLPWYFSLSKKLGDTLENIVDMEIELDNEQKYEFVIDEQFQANGQPLLDGLYTISFYATDQAGNRGGIEKVNFMRDFTEKVLKVTKDKDIFTHSTNIPVNFSIEYTQGGIRDFDFSIQNERGNTVRKVYAEGQGVYNVEWDGYDDNNTRVEDGQYTYTATITYFNGVELSEHGSIMVDSTPPQINTFRVVNSTINPRDKTRNNYELEVIQSSESEEVKWKASIFNIFEQELFSTEMEVLDTVTWDGRDSKGNIVPDGDYIYLLVGKDVSGNTVERDVAFIVNTGNYEKGKTLTIEGALPMIFFHGFSNDLFSYGEDTLLYENLLNIRSVAKMLRDNPGYKVRVIGHAAALLSGNRRKVEQAEVLLPLSRERAEQIRRALIILGVDSNSITTKAFGGAYPLITNPTQKNIWQNRRVEFELYQ